MKKFLFPFIAILLFSNLSIIYAQHGNFTAVPAKHFKTKSTNSILSPNGACDTVNLTAANNWSAYYYTYGPNGYVFGTSNNNANGFNIIEDANYFDVSASDYNYISGGLAYFAFANSTEAANLDKDLVFKVYDDDAGVPGNLLGSATLKLSQVKQDVENNFLTEFKFSSPIAMPASKTFYVSIDHSNFKWTKTVKDSIAIIANANDETTGAAYQYFNVPGSGTIWFPVNQFWTSGGDPLDVNLFIFPYVSNSADGCGVLPVSIFNFGGTIKSNQAYLNWSTATESNNKGFYIERSKDGQNFSSIGFVKGAGNSSQIKNYSYTDINLKDINVTTTYYRLKQVDLDGKSSYSAVLKLNLQNVVKSKLYPNPVKDIATLELSLDAASKVNAQVISRDGKILLNMDKGILNAGTQQIYINTQSLAKGTYLIRLTVGDKTYSQPFVKD